MSSSRHRRRGPGGTIGGGGGTPAPAAPPTDASRPDSALHALFREAWEWELRADPLLATSVGRHEHDHRLPSVAGEDLRRRADRRRAFLRRLGEIDRSALGTEDRISHDMFRRRLELAVRGHELREHLLPFTSETGFHTEFARLPAQMPFRSAEDYEDYLARLRAWPDYLEQQLAHLRRGLEIGMTQPRAVLDGLEPTIEAHVVEDPEQLLKEASWIAKRTDGKLPSLFGKLPRLPYGVAPVPDHLAPNYTAGRYVPPPLGSDRPGLYWVNTHDLESRPLYTLTALTLHEAVPGHHLQHAAQIEIEGLRKRAEEALGDAFDLRAFHDAILWHGTVPLPTLRAPDAKTRSGWTPSPVAGNSTATGAAARIPWPGRSSTSWRATASLWLILW